MEEGLREDGKEKVTTGVIIQTPWGNGEDSLGANKSGIEDIEKRGIKRKVETNHNQTGICTKSGGYFLI